MSRYYKTTENRVFDGVVNLVMILTLLICFLPFVYMAALSFSSSKAIINNQVSFWPVGFNLDAYKQIFHLPELLPGLRQYILLHDLRHSHSHADDHHVRLSPFQRLPAGPQIFYETCCYLDVFCRRHDPQLPACLLVASDWHPLGHAVAILHQSVQPHHHGQRL